MDWQERIDRIMTKLNLMLEKRYGCHVYFFEDSDDQAALGPVRDRQRIIQTARRNASAGLIISLRELIMPFRVNGKLRGVVSVSPIRQLEPKDISTIKDTLDLVISDLLKPGIERAVADMTLARVIPLRPDATLH